MKKQYVYAPSGQILCQYDCNGLDSSKKLIINGKYFYIHDRLGSVRLVTDARGLVRNTYTYTPFGEDFVTECNEQVYNPFKFTGQWYDSEIGQYYLRARMYDPVLMRFTARDPVRGKFQQPLSLHPYLYCWNNSINGIDPSGRVFIPPVLSAVLAGAALYNHGLESAAYAVELNPVEQVWDHSKYNELANYIPDDVFALEKSRM